MRSMGGDVGGQHLGAASSSTLDFLQLPSLDPGGSLDLGGYLVEAAWAPSACTAAVTVVPTGARPHSSLRVFLVSHSGQILAQTEVQVAAETVPAGLGGFLWSPDGLCLAAVLTPLAAPALHVLNGQDLSTVAAAELDPYLGQLPRLTPPETDPEAAIFSGAAEEAVCWQWLPSSTQVAIWAQQTTFGTEYSCGMLFMSLTPGGWELGGVLSLGQPLQQLLWGFGGLAGLLMSNEAVLLLPARPQCPAGSSPGWGMTRPAAADRQALPLQLTSQAVQLGCKGDIFKYRGPPAIAFAWAPSTCFLAVAACNGLGAYKNALMLHLIDGRSGVVRAERVVTRQRNLNHFIRRVHVAWSPDGSAVCVSLALAQHAMGFGESFVSKFVLPFRVRS